jgi:hypothetical protein
MKTVTLTVILIFFVMAFVWWSIESQSSSQSFHNLECFGRIDSIKVAARNSHYFYIAGEWRYFNDYGPYIKMYGEVGDSLVKLKGAEEILLFGRASDIGTSQLKKSIRIAQ